MKKRYYILNLCTLWLLMSVLIVGCTDEDLADSPSSETGGPAFLKLQLNELSGGTEIGENFESDIHSIRVIAYKSGTNTSPQCNYYVDALSANKTVQTDPIEVVAGKTDFYVIVNETSDMELAGDYITVSDIQNQILQYSSLTQSARDKSLTMYSELLSQVIPAGHDQANPFIVKDTVNRIMAKVTLKIQNVTHKGDVVLETAQIRSLPDKSFLSPSIYDCNKENLELSALIALSTTDKAKYDSVNFYIPEILLKDKAKRAYIEIKGTARDGAVDCTYKISLGDGLKDFTSEAQIESELSTLSAKDFAMHRNTHYEINVNDIKGYGTNQLTFVLNVLPWEENVEILYDGGFWVQQPVESKRIPRLGNAEFKAEFKRNTTEVDIEYTWMINRYPDGLVQPEEIKEIKDSISITTTNGVSTLKYLIAEPDMSGEIYCVAAAKGFTQYRESRHVTFMVVGDWVVKEGRFPAMENWTPPVRNLPMGTSYLLRDGRDGKVYRTKLMADGNWWMIQDLAYGKTLDEAEFLANNLNATLINLIADYTYGVSMASSSEYGGHLYNSIAAIQLPQRSEDEFRVDNDFLIGEGDIQGLCPKGWHVPGNKDMAYSTEWIVLFEKVLLVPRAAKRPYYPEKEIEKIEKFDYFNSRHFNIYSYWHYNQRKGLYEDHDFDFHGGYIAGLIFRDFYSFSANVSSYYGIETDARYLNSPDYGISLRCVLNDSRAINKK